MGSKMPYMWGKNDDMQYKIFSDEEVEQEDKMDNDLISRQAAIDAAVEAVDEWDGGYSRSREEIITLKLRMLPSAQPEIIACGDCKHWICHDRRCGYWNHGVKPLEWCCHAERRTDE